MNISHQLYVIETINNTEVYPSWVTSDRYQFTENFSRISRLLSKLRK